MDAKLSTLEGYLLSLRDLPEPKQLSVLRRYYSEMYQVIAEVGANKALLPKLSQWPLNAVFRVVQEAAKNLKLTSFSPGFSLNEVIDSLRPTVITVEEIPSAEEDHNMEEAAVPALEQARRNQWLKEEADAQKQKREGKPAGKGKGHDENREGKVLTGGKRKTQQEPSPVSDAAIEPHRKPTTGDEESSAESDAPSVPTCCSDKSKGKGKATAEELDQHIQEAKARVIRLPPRLEDEEDEDEDLAEQLAKIQSYQPRPRGEGTSKNVASSEGEEDRMKGVVEQAEEKVQDKDEDEEEEEAEEKSSTEAEEEPSDEKEPAAVAVTPGGMVIPKGTHIAPPPADGTVKGWAGKIASVKVNVPGCAKCQIQGNKCYMKWDDGPIEGACHYCSRHHISCSLSKRTSKSSKEPKEPKPPKAPKGPKPKEKKATSAGKNKDKKSRSAATKELAARLSQAHGIIEKLEERISDLESGSLVESLHATCAVQKDLEQATDRNFVEIARAYEELHVAHNELRGHVLALGRTDQFLFNNIEAALMGMHSHLPLEWRGTDPKVKPTQLNLRDSAGEPIQHRVANPVLRFAKYSLPPQGTVIHCDGPWPDKYATRFLPARTGEMFLVQLLNPQRPATATPKQVAQSLAEYRARNPTAASASGHRTPQAQGVLNSVSPNVLAPPGSPTLRRAFPVAPMMPTPLQALQNPQVAPSVSTGLGSKDGPTAQSSTGQETGTTDPETAADDSESMDVDEPPSVPTDRTCARRRAAEKAVRGAKQGRGRGRGGA
ncbi:hypothetical protein BJ165DRAFT_1607365 [Panaeolus papilionaceus]|nr:hypothetical protein BJ165DRAFT_1607365 [Panaeolus papilionaceus]